MTTHALDNPAFASEETLKQSLEFIGEENVDKAFKAGNFGAAPGGAGLGVVVGEGPEVEPLDPAKVTPPHDGTHPVDGELLLRDDAQARHDEAPKKTAKKRPADELFRSTGG